MNIDEFWKIIKISEGQSDPETIIENELKKLPPEEIIDYQEHFDTLHEKAYQWNLWGAAYIIEGGCSDDCFMDFRYGLISKGKEIYEKALENPDSLADLNPEQEISNESFGYAAMEAYEELTNKEIPRKEFTQPEEPIGKEWDFDDEHKNSKFLPKLTKLYWE